MRQTLCAICAIATGCSASSSSAPGMQVCCLSVCMPICTKMSALTTREGIGSAHVHYPLMPMECRPQHLTWHSCYCCHCCSSAAYAIKLHTAELQATGGRQGSTQSRPHRHAGIFHAGLQGKQTCAISRSTANAEVPAGHIIIALCLCLCADACMPEWGPTAQHACFPCCAQPTCGRCTVTSTLSCCLPGAGVSRTPCTRCIVLVLVPLLCSSRCACRQMLQALKRARAVVCLAALAASASPCARHISSP